MNISRKEKWSYAIAGGGQNAVNTIVGSFILAYMTAEYGGGGANLTAAGVIAYGVFMSVSKIWDAVNDPLMGVLIDKTHTKFGKLRPYILITALPIAILTILMYNVNIFSTDTGKLVFFGIVYLIWEMFYTLCDVPFWGMAARITNTTSDRTKIIALTRIVQIFGGIFAFALGTYGPGLFGGDPTGAKTQQGWTITIAIIAFIGMGLFTLAFFNTTEKNKEALEENVSLRDILKTAASCKPLLINLLGSFVCFGNSMLTVVGTAFLLNVLKLESIFSVLLLLALMSGQFVANLVAPKFINKYGTRNMALFMEYSMAVCFIIMYFIGYENIWLYMGLVVILGMASGSFLLIQTEMIAEAVDWIREREHKDREGVCFSGLTFSGKITAALATLSYTIIIYSVSGEKELGLVVTDLMRDALWMGMTLLPAITCLLSSIVYLFYPIRKQK